MNPAQTWLRFLVVLGVALILLSLLVLPWIRFPDPVLWSERLSTFLSDPQIQNALDNTPMLREWLGIPVQVTPGSLDQLVKSPELKPILTIAGAQRRLTGWDLWRLPQGPTIWLRISLVSILGLVGVALVWLVLSVVPAARPHLNAFSLVLAIAAAIGLCALLWHLPTIDTFGAQNDFSLLYACFLAGTGAGSGIWVAMIGLLLTAVASGLAWRTPTDSVAQLELDDRMQPQPDYISGW